jgi:hypothetical protein
VGATAAIAADGPLVVHTALRDATCNRKMCKDGPLHAELIATAPTTLERVVLNQRTDPRCDSSAQPAWGLPRELSIGETVTISTACGTPVQVDYDLSDGIS